MSLLGDLEVIFDQGNYPSKEDFSTLFKSVIPKQYVNGNVYNSVLLQITSTNTGFATGPCYFRPIQTQEGIWLLEMNIRWTITGATFGTFTIAGIDTAHDGGSQSVAMSAVDGAFYTNSYINNNSPTFVWNAGGNLTQAHFQGRIVLQSKPTWAD